MKKTYVETEESLSNQDIDKEKIKGFSRFLIWAAVLLFMCIISFWSAYFITFTRLNSSEIQNNSVRQGKINNDIFKKLYDQQENINQHE